MRDGSDVVLAWPEPTGIQLARVALPALPSPTADQQTATPILTAPTARKAPELEVRTLDGEQTTLAKFRGRPVLVNFWATWCEPCRMELPELARLDVKHKTRGLTVVGVSVDRVLTAAEVKAFAVRRNVSYALWYDPKESLAAAFGVQTLPASFLLDRAGNVVWRATGAIGSEDAALAAALEKAMSP